MDRTKCLMIFQDITRCNENVYCTILTNSKRYIYSPLCIIIIIRWRRPARHLWISICRYYSRLHIKSDNTHMHRMYTMYWIYISSSPVIATSNIIYILHHSRFRVIASQHLSQFLCPIYQQKLTGIMAGVSNYVQSFLSMLWHGWVNTPFLCRYI